MPVVQPADLWQETGRWQKYGPELMRVQDRHQHDFVFQPTSEEVMTDIVRQEIKSYRQLPVNFYHIQTKFRDERRPRFGLMRGREFTMKDAYSFDRDIDGLRRSYQIMYDAYMRIFNRFGLKFRAVAADNGAIGGSGSHEFHVIADTGEDALVYCPTSDYAANLEAAEGVAPTQARALPAQLLCKTPTPGRSTCAQVAEFLKVPLQKTVKSIVLTVEQGTASSAGKEAAGNENTAKQVWLLLLRGDHNLNEIKASKIPGLSDYRFSTETEIIEHFGTPPGYLGPLDLRRPVNIVADRTVAAMSDFICGANTVDFHYTGVNWGRDLPEPLVFDIRNVVAGDASPDGNGVLEIQRGIEVGHVFQLGTRYSADMQATYLDEAGTPQLLQMGCYGIGINAYHRCSD